MGGKNKFMHFFLSLIVFIRSSENLCTNGVCEKVSLTLVKNTKQDVYLEGYVFQKFSSASWQECFHTCLQNCLCLSFNFNEVNTVDNCELNDENTILSPGALKEKKGFIYFEPVRTYYDSDGILRPTCADESCQSHCCDSVPCQNGGTCSNVCNVNQRRFNCSCPRGFTGHRCQMPQPRSCKDVMLSNSIKVNGIYNILDQNNDSFPVYCEFHSEPGAAWTLIQSHSLQNNAIFKHKAFYLHDMPINQDGPEWNSYRLSMSRMKSLQDLSTHWRGTCNFPTNGVDFRDYIRVSLKSFTLLISPPKNRELCLFSEFINIRGNQCTNCTIWVAYTTNFGLHVDSWYGVKKGCNLIGGKVSEDNFGYYQSTNADFRCTYNMSSTSQYWLGSFQ